MAFIEIEHITHEYAGGSRALDDVSIPIDEGSFFSLLGPSGCGKTTLLNIVGGFLAPTSGRVLVGGRDIVPLAPHKRNIGMVFQNYALFPHMTVADNVAYGLKVQKRPKPEIAARVAERLELVHLDGFEARMPHQLSGGQQQRVAIARALANEPSILMLDEPLGNLDAKLRKEMQVELRRIQRSTGITTIMVTHDQEEAMTMSDGIAIMNEGRVQQVGSPREVYGRPRTSFVAGFLGKANMCPVTPAEGGRVESTEWFREGGVPLWFVPESGTGAGSIACIRPEDIRFTLDPHEGAISAVLRDVVYAGSTLQAWADLEGAGALELEIGTSGLGALPEAGQTVYLSWADEAVVLVEPSEVSADEG